MTGSPNCCTAPIAERADRNHRSAVLNELLHLRERLRRHLTLSSRELLRDGFRREAGAPAAHLDPRPAPHRLPRRHRPRPRAPGPGAGASPPAASRAAAAASAAPPPPPQAGAVEHDHVVLLAQPTFVDVRRKHALVRELEVLEHEPRPARRHVVVAVGVEQTDARFRSCAARRPAPSRAASKLTPRSVAAFCRRARASSASPRRRTCRGPIGPFCSHETSSPAASSRLIAMKLSFAWCVK